MNCKGNELAMVKVPEGIAGCEHNGAIVFITSLDPDLISHGNYWLYEGSLLQQSGERYKCIQDACLRPIGNPGEDAVDETLLWKKVPDYVKPKETVEA